MSKSRSCATTNITATILGEIEVDRLAPAALAELRERDLELALMPLDSRSAPLDWVQTLVRNARIQRACIAFARELPETAATHLSDYGVSLITSARAGKNAARARLELRERAQLRSSPTRGSGPAAAGRRGPRLQRPAGDGPRLPESRIPTSSTSRRTR